MTEEPRKVSENRQLGECDEKKEKSGGEATRGRN